MNAMPHEPKEAVERLRVWRIMNEPEYKPETKEELEKVGFELAGLFFNYIQAYHPNDHDLVKFMNQDKKNLLINFINGIDNKHGELLDHFALMLLEAIRKDREYTVPKDSPIKVKSQEEILKRDEPFNPFPITFKEPK